MAAVEWFYAKDNQQHGPVSAAELKRLALAGQIQGDDLVWREGLADWIPARKVKGLFTAEESGGVAEPMGPSASAGDAVVPQLVPAPSVPPAAAPRRPPRHLLDALLDGLRRGFPPSFVEATLRLFTSIGYYGLYAAMAVVILYVLLVAVQDRRLDHVPQQLVLLAAIVILQYAARRFCATLDRLNRATPVAVASAAFLDCFALLHMVGGVAALVTLTWLAVQTGLYFLIAPAVAAFILGQSGAVMAVHPQTLQVEIAKGSTPWEELIGVLSFLVKFGARITPVALGIGVVCGIVVLGYACVLTIFPPSERPSLQAPGGLDVLSELLESGEGLPGMEEIQKAVAGTPAEQAARRGEAILLVSAALPVVMYFWFLAYYLAVELLQAVLAIPGKLDRLGAGGGPDSASDGKGPSGGAS